MLSEEFGLLFINQNPKLKKAMEDKIAEAIQKIDTDKLSEMIWGVLTDEGFDWLFEDMDIKDTLNECLNSAIKKLFKGK